MGPDSPASDEIRRFEEQYRRQPESLVFARLADAYRKAGQPKRALAVLEEGLIRHPDYPSGHIVRARALRDMGRVDETLESFRRVLELDAANLVAIRELAGLADERGDVDEARHWYERLGQIDPTNLEVSQRLRELETASVEPVPAEPVENEPVENESVESGDEAEGPHSWWDDSAVNSRANDVGADGSWDAGAGSHDGDASEEERRPEDEVVEAILNGAVSQSVRAEDTWWFEEAPDHEEPEPSKDADLLTRTMADLYAEQGLHREAAEIYEELLRDSPGDPELLARLEAVRHEGWDVPGGAADGTAHSDETGEAQQEAESPGEAGVAGVGEAPVPLGRPVGNPWPEELRRLLRMGEERAGALPDPETSDPAPAEASAVESGASDEVAADRAADPEDGAQALDSDGSGPSRFARDWIGRLETDG